MQTIELTETHGESLGAPIYVSIYGHRMQREMGYTPDGEEINGRWVLSRYGVIQDIDPYRNDLAQRNGLYIIYH